MPIATSSPYFVSVTDDDLEVAIRKAFDNNRHCTLSDIISYIREKDFTPVQSRKLRKRLMVHPLLKESAHMGHYQLR